MSETPYRFFAVCARGLEEPLADELKAVGARQIAADRGGVGFAGTLATAYAANLHSRIASRVLWQVGQHRCETEDEIYEAALAVDWHEYMSPQQTLRVDLSASHFMLRSLEFAMLRVKDGIVDQMRERAGSRPSIDRERPHVRVFAHFEREELTLYLDLSGLALFKRGWRADKGKAPIKENLAAGLLMLSGWTPEQPLLDPFCGSGTIAIEAACIAARRAPGLNRPFGFQRLAGFDAIAWRQLQQAAQEAIDDDAEARIFGSDISTQVIELARANAGLAKLAPWLRDGRLAFAAGDARQVLAPAGSGMIVTNPPYGEQSAPRSASVARLMAEFGDQLKKEFAGWSAWLFSSDLQLPSQLRLSETRRVVLYNGPLECRLFRFGLVRGQYRPRAAPATQD